jgi:rSAM/selenodomain-associated transferase 2
VPMLDEVTGLPALIEHLAALGPGVEVVVVDGGSSDGSAELALRSGLRVVEARRGRARQLNVGAAATSAGRLLFLHADTRLPPGAVALVHRTLDDPGVAMGAFSLRLDRRGRRLRIIEAGIAVRSRFAGLPLGDQAQFLRRETFDALGGFADMPILEDMDLASRAGELGWVHTRPEAVVTSARRWADDGIGWRPGPAAP